MHVCLRWQTLDTVSSWRPLPPPACLQMRCPFSKADVLAGKVFLEGCPEAPTLDSDAGAAGHLPCGVLSQTGVGAIILWEGVLDVELGHASLAGGVGVLDGLSWGGKHRRAQAREKPAEGWESCPQQGGCCHDAGAPHTCSGPLRAHDVLGPPPASWIEAQRGEKEAGVREVKERE